MVRYHISIRIRFFHEMLLRCFPIAFLMLLVAWKPVSAELSPKVLEKIEMDLAPISGYILTEEAGEYVIDLKEKQGVVAGDLISVIGEGRELLHPVTGKLIGKLEGKKGLLKLTRVRPDYSFAKMVKGNHFERGNQVIRYGEMPAVFRDHTGKGETIFARLRETLPCLDWKYITAEDGSPGKRDLTGPIFMLYDDRLEIRGTEFELIRNYSLKEKMPVAQTSPQIFSQPSSPERPVLIPRETGISSALNLHGRIDRRILQSDFIQEGNRILSAATDSSLILVYAPEEGTEPIFQCDTALPGQILWVSWWKPEGSNNLYLAVTSATEETQGSNIETVKKIDGTLFLWQHGKLTPVHRGLEFLMAAFDRNNDGIPETLLGQRFDRDIFFGNIREIRWKGNRIENETPSFFLPAGFPVFGSTFADLSGNGKTEVIFIRNRTLFIHDDNGLLYESSDDTGGSLNHFTYTQNPGTASQIFKTVNLEIPPLSMDIDDDGQLELLIIASDSSLFSLFGTGLNIRKSYLSVMDFTQGGFTHTRSNSSLEQAIQGLDLIGKTVWLINTYGSRKTESSLFYSFP